MPEVVRVSADSHIGHASPTPSPFHKTAYSTAGQSKVFAQGNLVVLGDSLGSTSCGDPAVGKSPKVFVDGTGVHRKGDGTDGHGSWVPNAAATGSPKVWADG